MEKTQESIKTNSRYSVIKRRSRKIVDIQWTLWVISECRSRSSNAQWNGRKLILTQWRADEQILCRQQKVSAMPHVLYTRDFFRHCCTSKAFAQRTMGTGNHNQSQLNAHVHCIACWFRYWLGTNNLSFGYWFSSLEYIRKKTSTD